MKIDSIQSNLETIVGASRDSIPTLADHTQFGPNKFFWVIYNGLICYIIANSIGYYFQHDNSSQILVVGLVLPFSTFAFSFCMINFEPKLKFSKKNKTRMNTIIYFITGLTIVFSDPQVNLLFIGKEDPKNSACYFLLSIFIKLGGNNLVNQKSLFLTTSLSFTFIGFGLLVSNTSSIHYEILSLLLLLVYICWVSTEIKEFKEQYQIIASEEVSAFRIDQPTTPIEEILYEIHEGIEKILDVSKNTSPGIQRLYKKIVRLFKNVIKKIQTSGNLYLPCLELVTKNMDADDKIYIEQEFFEVQNMKKRFSDLPVVEKVVSEYGMSELAGFLKMMGKEWNFNTFFVAGCTKNPALVMGKYAMKMYGLDELYSICNEKLEGFLSEIEKNYPQNPYHNSLHGADVMCSFLYILANSCLSEFINSLDWFAGIIASLCHDVGHPGKNNRFLVMSGHEIALTYNDISVLEMMHASILFKIAKDPAFNIFSELSFEKFTQLRRVIVEMILATDMSKHFDILSYVRTKYNDECKLNEIGPRVDLFKLCIKSADVGHAAKSIDLHEKWCLSIIEEFFLQGDLEKEKGLPVSMYCDRETTNVAKSQAGFIKNIVLGLFSTMNSILLSNEIEKMCIIQLQNNEKYWESIGKQRNLSSAFKNDEDIQKIQIIPMLRKRTTRLGSLPAAYGTQASNDIDEE